jgi:hypothetical protein|uniref:Uncharacterized protein n=1 Tax=Klebsiella pneumoniae TaxID=573 RepID=A0A486VZD1_KLEPN|nr:Uncharacterised protein [Klebsiella pneumoniae]
MLLRKLTWPLLRMLLRQLCRRTVTRLLDYCRHAGWPDKEIQNVRRALIVLFRILLRLLRVRLIKRNRTASFSPDNTAS